ncbi:MAG: sulfite exporter TauE/SafE family protein [bacterium]
MKVKAFWRKLFFSNSYLSFLLIGLLNGFLPCGLVYITLAAAASTGLTVNGLMYKMMFGIGTIPIMLAVSYLGLFIRVSQKKKLQKLIPVGGVILAVLIIFRRLSLSIPYISPKIGVDQAGEQKVECFHAVEK